MVIKCFRKKHAVHQMFRFVAAQTAAAGAAGASGLDKNLGM
jgi:hypothetical protein